MTTAEAIEGIADAGKFEILATRALRISDEDCRLLDHMGVNALGKTIANPIDSFCRVPGTDPPRFVMAAFTTDKAESLERKWIFDHSAAPHAKKATAADDGDLIKANRRADLLRNDHPGALFVVHLCTNKQPDDQVMMTVIKKGQELGLDVRFLTRSRLRDLLDVSPDGQWLRKEHLGIQAERLSSPLLRELSAKSLYQYGREFLITPPGVFVTTTSERALAKSIVPSRSIYIMTGTSGSGKSVSCYQVLRRHLDQGGVGLWIPGELAARATSFEEAIDLTLRSLHPTLEPASATVTLGLVSASQRLVVVVDDINRGGRPAESLRKILAWGHISNNRGNSVSSFAILVPAWDLFWSPLDKQFSSASWLARIPINKMEEVESLACLDAALGPRLLRFSEADRRKIVEALGHDPILIALYASSVADHEQLHSTGLAIEVIDRYVQTTEAEAATMDGYLQDEYDLALSHLAARMLNQRDLYPRWDAVQELLPADEVHAIRELARLGKICQVTGRGGQNRFEFRHDRILEHFLVRALQALLSNVESNANVLTDPFYASFIGRAVALSQPSDELLGWIQKHNPLALISSLRFLSALPNHTADRLAAAAKHWLEAVSMNRCTPPVVLYEAYWRLEETDTPYLLDVTQSLSRHRLLARARLANGDAAAGVVEFSDSQWFAPSVNDRGLDAVLSRAIHRHKQSLTTACVEMLQ
ncbi:MAG TPA: hypothetical protein VLX29_09875, partial [Nitrospirota bacterium]|nr:hypothetical protein [Nitrospirota bacterium]